MMQTARALIWAESIKLRRTAAAAAPVAASALAVLLQFVHLGHIMGGPPNPDWTSPGIVWADLLRGGWDVWLVLILPMLIFFEAASLANLEHNGNKWKQLFACPIPRWTTYATKMLFCALLVAAGFAVVALGLICSSLIFSAFEGLNLTSAIPWLEIVRITGKTFLASWLMIVIQSWLSAQFSGLGPPIGIGSAAWIFGVLLFGIHRSFVLWYPWMLPLGANADGGPVHNTVFPTLFGCVGGLLVAILACWDLARRRDR